MSLRLPVAAERAYDLLKTRPGARPRRRSGARDARALAAVERRLNELIAAYRVHGHEASGTTYVFWAEVETEVGAGAFDDLLSQL